MSEQLAQLEKKGGGGGDVPTLVCIYNMPHSGPFSETIVADPQKIYYVPIMEEGGGFTDKVQFENVTILGDYLGVRSGVNVSRFVILKPTTTSFRIYTTFSTGRVFKIDVWEVQ